MATMQELTIKKRDGSGKGYAKRLRREGAVPAVLYDGKPHRSRALTKSQADVMNFTLSQVVQRGTGTGAQIGTAVAGKTGTTEDFGDAWFVGFSSSVVAGVWVGFDQPSPIGRDAYAARTALPIWADFMKRTARALPAREFAMPSGLRDVELCSVSYMRPVEGCTARLCGPAQSSRKLSSAPSDFMVNFSSTARSSSLMSGRTISNSRS